MKNEPILQNKKGWLSYFNLKEINPVIKILTLVDFLSLSGFGLITPIFAVFVEKNIIGGNVAVVGLASAIYSISQSIFQIPIAHFIDKTKGEKDDFWVMFIGAIACSLIPLFCLIIYLPWQLYLLQFFYGLFGAMTLPPWYAIFTRHIDKHKEGTEWGIYRTLTDMSSALAASLGGFIAYNFGFKNLFITASIVSFIGYLFLIMIYDKMKRA